MRSLPSLPLGWLALLALQLGVLVESIDERDVSSCVLLLLAIVWTLVLYRTEGNRHGSA